MKKEQQDLLEYLSNITVQDLLDKELKSINTIKEDGYDARIYAKTINDEYIQIHNIEDYEKIISKTQKRKNKLNTIL